MKRYGVSNTIIKNVRQILVSEGLVVARKGSGVYVADEPRRLIRHAHGRPQRERIGSPFAKDARKAGYQASWQFHSERGAATESGTGATRDDVPLGVVARMDSIGVRISHVVEEVEDRAATPEKIEELRLPPTRTGVLHLQRTYCTADDQPVETADIVLPGRRYRLHYRIPIA